MNTNDETQPIQLPPNPMELMMYFDSVADARIDKRLQRVKIYRYIDPPAESPVVFRNEAEQ